MWPLTLSILLQSRAERRLLEAAEGKAEVGERWAMSRVPSRDGPGCHLKISE